jgi:hypothetical protein
LDFRKVPQLLVGLVAIALALGIAVPVTAGIVTDGMRDIKLRRDTIAVIGSARQPIEANLAQWELTVTATERTPAAAARSVGRKVTAVDSFLHDSGLTGGDVRKPPLSVDETTIRVPTGKRKPAFRAVPAWRVSQSFDVTTKHIDRLEKAAGSVDDLLLQGIDVSVERIQYLSTGLKSARLEALRKAIAEARKRGETIADGLGGDLGAVRKVELGVYQIVPRNSTDVSDYGINDTSTRDKDVVSVVTVTFAVSR